MQNSAEVGGTTGRSSVGRARRAASFAVAGACLSTAPAARAVNPLNSSDRTTLASQAACVAGDVSDFNIVPIVGGTSDIGIGVGEFSNLARISKGCDPYLWNLETAVFISFKLRDRTLIVPYQDVYAKLTLPELFGTPTRIELRPSYTWESTLGYYGLGNAAPPAPPGVQSSFNQYGRLHPAVDLLERFPVIDHLSAILGVRYTQNWNQVSDATKLSLDLRFGSPEVKHLLAGAADGGVALFSVGAQWDDRDSEVSPHRGSFHEAQFKFSPGGSATFPYRYGQGSVVSRLFVPIAGERVTLALRAVGDILFGTPPFFELSRFDDTYALGGIDGVRGIPAQRYYGKVKVFGNIETRARLVTFRALGKGLTLGFVAFLDGGRVWADTTPQPALDGTGVGLKYGVGTGVRIESGETFVLRADVAWSPDARPIAAYFSAGRTF